MEGNGLFRMQALAHRMAQYDGRPRLISPPGVWLLCTLLLSGMAVTCWFLAGNDYTRKATVTGYIETSNSAKRVYSPRSAVIRTLNVRPGEQVIPGQLLARLDTNDGLARADRNNMLTEYDRQLVENEHQQAVAHRQAVLANQQTQGKLDATSAALARLQRIIQIQSAKVDQLGETCDAARPLYRSGHLSKLEWSRFRASWLDARQQLEQLKGQADEKRESLASTQRQLSEQQSGLENRISNLEQAASKIRQSRQSLLAGRQSDIRAGISGRIVNIFAQPGESVTSRKPLLSIRPQGTVLVAHLLVPSRSAGFLQPGQTINLLYDAFPYQRFGTYPANLVSISHDAMMPGDSELPVSGRQPWFEAIASIDQPWVSAYGKRLPVRAGMSLKADILLEHRSLAQWLLAPLIASSKRGL